MAAVSVKLKAVWRIEGDGKAIAPGDAFQMRDTREAERLVRIGAAVLDADSAPEAGA